MPSNTLIFMLVLSAIQAYIQFNIGKNADKDTSQFHFVTPSVQDAIKLGLTIAAFSAVVSYVTKNYNLDAPPAYRAG
jgi:hypothetical protein